MVPFLGDDGASGDDCEDDSQQSLRHAKSAVMDRWALTHVPTAASLYFQADSWSVDDMAEVLSEVASTSMEVLSDALQSKREG